jgi:hypothetical protein
VCVSRFAVVMEQETGAFAKSYQRPCDEVLENYAKIRDRGVTIPVLEKGLAICFL